MSSLDRILPFLAPIRHLLTDPDVTEVMVQHGGRVVYVEREGLLALQPQITAMPHLDQAIKHIARACGAEVSDQHPILDARLEDGSRVAAMISTCAVDGPVLTIRRFGRRYSLDSLMEIGTLTDREADELEAAVRARRTLLISGGTGTGKTTLLNALAAYIPRDERLGIIEETTELTIGHPNVFRFQVRQEQPAELVADRLPAVTIADLLRASLRHRPDRLIVGEVRGGEAFYLLQALNTGHRGSLSTIHANSAALALNRLEDCALESGLVLSADSLSRSVRTAIDLVVHLERVDGRRQVTELYEVPSSKYTRLASVGVA